MDDVLLATVTVTKTLTDDDTFVETTALTSNDEPLPLLEALGMMRLAEDSLIRQAMGEPGLVDDADDD